MSTQFIDSLNALTSGTALSFKLFEKNNVIGNLESDVYLFSNLDTRDQVCHAKLYFRNGNNGASVSAQISDTHLYAESPNLDKCFEYLEKALQLVKQVLASTKIRAEYQNYANEINEASKAKHNQKVAELSETHILLDRDTAKSMLESYIQLIRNIKANTSNQQHHAVKDFRLFTLNNDGTTVGKTLTIQLDKRISLFLSSEGISKADALSHMIGMWAPKLGK